MEDKTFYCGYQLCDGKVTPYTKVISIDKGFIFSQYISSPHMKRLVFDTEEEYVVFMDKANKEYEESVAKKQEELENKRNSIENLISDFARPIYNILKYAIYEEHYVHQYDLATNYGYDNKPYYAYLCNSGKFCTYEEILEEINDDINCQRGGYDDDDYYDDSLTILDSKTGKVLNIKVKQVEFVNA